MTAYNLLIISRHSGHHLNCYIKYLKSLNLYANIDLLVVDDDVPDNVKEFLNCYYYIRTTQKFGTIRLLVKIYKQLLSLSKQRYDVVNVQFPYWFFGFFAYTINKLSPTLLVSPWGSDIYRISRLKRIVLRRLFNRSTSVSLANNRFGKDCQKIMNIPDSKIVNLEIGLENIDYILANKYRIPKIKECGKYVDKLVITCGYNASPSQNHLQIIESINSVKEQLPPFVLFFPMTYSRELPYVNKVKKLVSDYNLEAVFFESFLPKEKYFDLIANTDIFVHMQTTDSDSGSLKEYVLCEKKVINAAWLQYSDLCHAGSKGYTEVSGFSNLGTTICQLSQKQVPIIDEHIIDSIASQGWNYQIEKWNDYMVQKCLIRNDAGHN